MKEEPTAQVVKEELEVKEEPLVKEEHEAVAQVINLCMSPGSPVLTPTQGTRSRPTVFGSRDLRFTCPSPLLPSPPPASPQVCHTDK